MENKYDYISHLWCEAKRLGVMMSLGFFSASRFMISSKLTGVEALSLRFFSTYFTFYRSLEVMSEIFLALLELFTLCLSCDTYKEILYS